MQKNIIKNAPYLRLLLREPQRIFHSDPQKTIDGKSWYFSCYLIFCFISGFSITFCLYNLLLLLLRIKQTKKLLGRKKKKDPTYGWMDGSVQQHPSSLQPSELKRNPCDLLLLILSSGEYLMPCVWWFFFLSHNLGSRRLNHSTCSSIIRSFFTNGLYLPLQKPNPNPNSPDPHVFQLYT